MGNLLEVCECQVHFRWDLVRALDHSLLERVKLHVDFHPELLGHSVTLIFGELASVSDLEAVRGHHSDLEDGVIDAIRFALFVVMLFTFFELHAINFLESDFIAVLKLMLVGREKFDNTLLFV